MKNTGTNSQKPLNVRIIVFCDSHLKTQTGQPHHRAVRAIKATLLNYVEKHKAGGKDEEFSSFIESIKLGLEIEIAKYGRYSPHIPPIELFHKLIFDFKTEGMREVDLANENQGRIMLRKYYINPLQSKGCDDAGFVERFNNERFISDLKSMLDSVTTLASVIFAPVSVSEEVPVEN